MSFYKDFVAEGMMCETCGQLIDGTEPGYPRQCTDCGGDAKVLDDPEENLKAAGWEPGERDR